MKEKEKFMKVQQKASGDTRLGKDAIECVVKMSQQVREYLSYAIEYANNQNHETPEQFWTYLFWNVTKKSRAWKSYLQKRHQ